MEKHQPIGIFDSGVGGLTVAREIIRSLPGESIIYLGDTANLPYGEKSGEIVTKYAVKNTRFLLDFGIKVLVVACNTATAVALNTLKTTFNIPIIGVVEPAVKGALYATRNQKIGVIGTNRTIESDIYASSLKNTQNNIHVSSKACPLFVPLIEENFINHEATKLIATDYLKDFEKSGIDTMILGCTHYPLISGIIGEILPGVKLVDSASSTAKDLKDLTETMHIQNPTGQADHRFFTTDMTDKLHALATKILKDTLPAEQLKFQEIEPIQYQFMNQEEI